MDLVCTQCASRYSQYNGSFDFTAKTKEKNFYEKRYYKTDFSKRKSMDFQKLNDMWYDIMVPERKKYIERIGTIRNKDILLLGNGSSIHELYFLKFGNRIIYSDVSLNVVRNIKNKYKWGKFREKIVFHAIDAFNIPLNNESIDLILGYAFVHHLNDYGSFFEEVERILKPGGRCIFYDAAYSSIWQTLKFSIFKPFVNFAHRKTGISPEDLRATHRGGYKQQEIEDIKIMYDFADMTFERFGLLYKIFSRAMGKFFGYGNRVIKIKRKFIPILFRVDNYLASVSYLYYHNTMSLVWGFIK